MFLKIILLLIITSIDYGESAKCDQTPPQAKVLTPSENNNIFQLSIDTKDSEKRNLYLPDQTYVLILSTNNMSHPIRWFMITAEDADIDNNSLYDYDHQSVDVGSLKTLDTDRLSRYSERCYSSIENADNSNKEKIEIHWVSPKQSANKQRVRFRATVAENEEVWYTGDNLTVVLEKNDHRPIDSPPYLPTEKCNLTSEARYEVIFKGQWSRMSHPRNYPSKPDDNGYTHMVGASHSYDHVLWKQGDKASPGLKLLVEDANITLIEREIIDSMAVNTGTRTLIRGKRRHHPHMLKPSHALFRVDSTHHLFSIVVGMRPSPDWFLGASRFELCTDLGWLESSEIPLYPWDAGTVNGISYESPKSMTQPVDKIERVAVGSFDRDSPFYQMNLNDLKPFASLQVRRLDVYPLQDCSYQYEEKNEANIEVNDDTPSEDEVPQVAESRLDLNMRAETCKLSEWGTWSSCVPRQGTCGIGSQTRTRYRDDKNPYYESYSDHDSMRVKPLGENCPGNNPTTQFQDCIVEC